MTTGTPQVTVLIEHENVKPVGDEINSTSLNQAQTPPRVGLEPARPQATVINIYTGAEPPSKSEQGRPNPQQVGPAQINGQQTLLKISQTLDTITKQMSTDRQRSDTSGPSLGSTIVNAGFTEELKASSPIPPLARNHKTKHIAPSHHFDWMHGFNLLYTFTILFTLLLPASAHTFLGTEILPSKQTIQKLGIEKWDLFIAKEAIASMMFEGDVISLHNPTTGKHEVAQVSKVVKSVDDLITFTIAQRTNQDMPIIYSIPSSAEIYKIEKTVPRLGLVQALLDSIYVQILVAFLVAFLNITVHFRRQRKHISSLITYSKR